ncbi:hypothetical protein [Micromonospora sp. DT47]|uniref:hypothetical protein n=1 Tax=Micromonospora sp. DT47 TaxID=3393431 RepID=UPI003CF1C3AB
MPDGSTVGARGDDEEAPVPELLTSATVRDLRREPRGGWSRGAAGGLVLAGGSVLLVAVMASAPYPPCTDADPCGPDRAGNLVIGLVVSTVFAGWLGLRLAAALGVVIAAGLAWYILSWPDEGPSGWTVALALGYALGVPAAGPPDPPPPSALAGPARAAAADTARSPASGPVRRRSGRWSEDGADRCWSSTSARGSPWSPY